MGNLFKAEIGRLDVLEMMGQIHGRLPVTGGAIPRRLMRRALRTQMPKQRRRISGAPLAVLRGDFAKWILSGHAFKIIAPPYDYWKASVCIRVRAGVEHAAMTKMTSDALPPCETVDGGRG